jgi:hypothetical protein
MNKTLAVLCCELAVLGSTGWTPAAPAAGSFESPPVIKAVVLAPKDVPLKGANYVVDADVATDGLLATFTIRSDYGVLAARGPGMLRLRVAEVDALTRLKAMKKSDVFVDSLKKSANALGQAVVGVATNPVETAKAIPAGVSRFLERTARQVKTGVQKVDDVRQQKEAGAPRGAAASATTQNVALAAGAAAGRATRDALGYDEKRRDLARELRVDPYTTNPVLKKELDDVAWAAFAGGLGVNALASKVPGGRLVQSTSLVTDWIYEKPPGDLKVWIEKTLKGLGVGQETVDLFLRQKYWTLTTQTALVMALDKMAGVEGRAEVLDEAVTAESEDQARFLAVGFSLLAREHARDPIKAVLGGRPAGLTQKGRALVTVPVDYVCWTERVATFASRDDLLPRKPMVMVTGRLSERTRTEMKKLGWEVREGLPLAGSF